MNEVEMLQQQLRQIAEELGSAPNDATLERLYKAACDIASNIWQLRINKAACDVARSIANLE